MKRSVAVMFLASATAIFIAEPSIYAQRGRGGGVGGGGGASQGALRGNSGNSGNAGANKNDSGNSGPKSDNAKAPGDKKVDNKVANDIHLQPKLEEKVKALLPPNTSLADASAGFKNQGQFIAALHVSKNLNIPFADLKSRVTGEHPMSLGEAIQKTRPELGKAKTEEEVKRAEKEAKDTEKSGKA